MNTIDRPWCRDLRRGGALALLAVTLAACGSGTPAPVVTGNPEIPPQTQIVVARGQTLSGIAHAYHLPMAVVAEANRLTPPYRIRVGEVLVIPTGGAAAPPGPVVAMAEPVPTPPPASALQPMTAPAPAAEVAVQPLPPERTAPIATQPLPGPAEHMPPVPGSPGSAPTGLLPPREPAMPHGAAMPPAVPPEAIKSTMAPAPAPGSMPSESAASAHIPPATRPGAGPVSAEHQAPSGSSPTPGPTASAEAPPAAVHNTGSFLWPVRGHVLAGFGAGPEGTRNDGINIAAPRGAAVEATDGGVVAYTGNELRGYGNLVLIKHPGGWISAYAHCDLILVKPGQKVARGQVIARVGATGNVGEPQLHFELRRGKKPVDPREYLVPVSTAGVKQARPS